VTTSALAISPERRMRCNRQGNEFGDNDALGAAIDKRKATD
jgi:hypothetical protein